MGDKAGTEKGFFPGKGAVDELVHDHKRSGREIFLEGTHRTDGKNVGTTGGFQALDIRPIVNHGWGDPMSPAVPRKESRLRLIE